MMPNLPHDVCIILSAIKKILRSILPLPHEKFLYPDKKSKLK